MSGRRDAVCVCGQAITTTRTGTWEHNETGSDRCFAPGGGARNDDAVATPEDDELDA